MAKKRKYVIYLSPGTFVSEISQYPIDEWDVPEAVKMSKKVKERYGATPYGFYFETRVESDPVPDGDGGLLDVKSKQVAKSNMYYLGGKIFSYAEVKERDRKDEEILLSNMLCNNFAYVVENCNSYKVVQPFGETDVVVGDSGETLFVGNSPKMAAYRQKFKEEQKEYFDSFSGG